MEEKVFLTHLRHIPGLTVQQVDECDYFVTFSPALKVKNNPPGYCNAKN